MKRSIPGRNMFITVLLLCIVLACVRSSVTLFMESEPSQMQELVVWHYYNGMQQQYFDDMVEAFNEGVGRTAGIQIVSVGKVPFDKFTTALLDASAGRDGAEPMPDIFTTHADMAYHLFKNGKIADLSDCLTAEEWARYIPQYLAEGEFEPGGIMVVPVSKSTDLMFINETDWDTFSEETGVTGKGLSTWEGLGEIAERYYDWTDSLTRSEERRVGKECRSRWSPYH